MEISVLLHKKIYAVIAILFVWGMLYLPSLGVNDLSRNEARRITPALTMMKTGDFITPMLSGKPYYRKPPMMNWLLVGILNVTGLKSVFVYRFVTTLIALFTALLLLYLPSELIDLKSRFIASSAFLTTFGFTFAARTADIDPNYACAAGLAIIFWLHFHFKEKSNKWSKWIIPAFPLAFGVLLKGPLILVVYYILIVAVLVFEKKSRELLSWQHIFSVILFLAPFLLWSFLLKQGHVVSADSSETGSGGVWLHEMACRFNFEGISFKKWLRRFSGGFAQFLPWLLVFPLLWNKKLLLRLSSRQLVFVKSAKIAIPIIFIMIYIMPLAKARYSLPLLVPLALVAALTLLHLQLNDKWKKISLYIIFSLCAVAVIYSIILFASLITLRMGVIPIDDFSEKVRSFFEVYASTSLVLAFLSLFFALTFGILLFRNRKNPLLNQLFTQLVVIIFIMTISLSHFFVYLLPSSRSSKHFAQRYAEEINLSVPKMETICGVGFVGEEPFVPYFSFPWIMVDQPTDLNDEIHYFLIQEKRLDNLNEYRIKYDLHIIARKIFYYKKHKYLLIQLGKKENE